MLTNLLLHTYMYTIHNDDIHTYIHNDDVGRVGWIFRLFPALYFGLS